MDETAAERALKLAAAAAAVGQYCDHAEHNEVTDREWILEAARELLTQAREWAAYFERDLRELYVQRLGEIEHRNPLYEERDLCDRARTAKDSERWIQLIQAEHDRIFHPDVFGMSKYEQMRHYAFHISKLCGAFSDYARGEEIDLNKLVEARLPDLVLFGVKLPTAVGVTLDDTPIFGEIEDNPF